MNVCSVCKEIVSVNQGCDRSDCPHQRSASTSDPAPKVELGFTGRADRSVQAGLDKAGDAARDATRRAAFVVAAVFVVALFAMIFIFYVPSRSGSSETVTVTVAQDANVRNAASAEGSMVLETLAAGTQLNGSWVSGSTVPSERWLELEGGDRFVWSGNLKEKSSGPLTEAPNAMAFVGKYPYEKIAGYGILDAPDLQSTIRAMPNGDEVWARIILEDADLDVESPIDTIQPGRDKGIVIHKCEARNCGGAGSRQLHIEYFPSAIPEDRLVFVCFLRGRRLESFDSYGNSSMYGTECTKGGFDYGD